MRARAVFDCMVFLQEAARDTGPAAASLQQVREGLVELFLSPQLVGEVRDVLTRPRTQQKFPDLTPERVEVFLRDVEGMARMLAEVPGVFTYPRDPKDELYVNLALAAGARYLVTWDHDLLDLMNEQTPEGQDFRGRFPGLIILTPVAFLSALSPSPG
jgi:putative PIN family toxin of toxin-antitoxin system